MNVKAFTVGQPNTHKLGHHWRTIAIESAIVQVEVELSRLFTELRQHPLKAVEAHLRGLAAKQGFVNQDHLSGLYAPCCYHALAFTGYAFYAIRVVMIWQFGASTEFNIDSRMRRPVIEGQTLPSASCST